MNKSFRIIPLILSLFLFSCVSTDQKQTGLSTEFYNNRGIILYEGDKFDEAISDFSEVIKINPRYANAYFNRGLAYYHKDQYDQAISDYTKALEINPRDVLAYIYRGRAYYLKGEYNRFWEDIHKAQSSGYRIPPKFLDDFRKASGK